MEMHCPMTARLWPAQVFMFDHTEVDEADEEVEGGSSTGMGARVITDQAQSDSLSSAILIDE